MTGLKLENVNGISVEGLKISDQREKLSAGILVTEDSANVQITKVYRKHVPKFIVLH